jgi:serine/threonine protein kinase
MMTPQMGREPLRRWDPERIGPYVILGRLGAGAMGQVYLGRSAAGRLVAVKTIKVGLAEEPGFRTRFAQEVAAARRVSGAFTAAVIEADPEADVPWLATTYVPAPSLNRLVQACGPMPVRTVRWLAAGCAEALESIHSVGLVHRDLKPSNVLVAPDGPRVIDFGVARAAERMELTTARGAVGTPAYMAPEQARDTRQASAASDMYSLGATLVFAATGHPPYVGDTVMDVLSRLATEPPDLSGLPADLVPLVTDCMQRVPRERLTSSALLSQLGQFTEARVGPEHSYLPGSAMTLIGDYQQNPQFAVQGADGEPAGEHSDDATSASYGELPASRLPAPRRERGQARRAPRSAGWRQWLRAHMAWAGWAAVGAALVVGGVILGASLSSQGTPAPPAAPPPPPDTACNLVKLGPGPGLCMNQAAGDQTAAFTVRGSGFDPRESVTVALTGLDPTNKPIADHSSPISLVTGGNGTLNFMISQLYRGSLPLGIYTVTVTAPNGGQVHTQFMVLPPGGSPGGPPPSG